MRGKRGQLMVMFAVPKNAPLFLIFSSFFICGRRLDQEGWIKAKAKYRGLSAAAAKAPPSVEMTGLWVGLVKSAALGRDDVLGGLG
jgi:hypothetical protein